MDWKPYGPSANADAAFFSIGVRDVEAGSKKLWIASPGLFQAIVYSVHLLLEEPTQKRGGGKPGFAPATRRKPGFQLKKLVLLPETCTQTIQNPQKCFLKTRLFL